MFFNIHPASSVARNVRSILGLLKRRWFLLACAVVLLRYTCIDHYKEIGRRALKTSFGLKAGALFYSEEAVPDTYAGARWLGRWGGHVKWPDEYKKSTRVVHLPQFGELSLIGRGFYIPLWLPLSVVVAWLVIRELRWREKRAKGALATP